MKLQGEGLWPGMVMGSGLGGGVYLSHGWSCSSVRVGRRWGFFSKHRRKKSLRSRVKKREERWRRPLQCVMGVCWQLCVHVWFSYFCTVRCGFSVFYWGSLWSWISDCGASHTGLCQAATLCLDQPCRPESCNTLEGRTLQCLEYTDMIMRQWGCWGGGGALFSC